MTDIPDSSSYKIISLAHDNPPLGVNHTKPAWQIVHINGPVQNWVLHKVGHDKYRFSIDGYPYTRVHDGKVIASIYPEHEVEWKITHHEDHEHYKAYTITLANKPHLGWTVPVHLAQGHQVELRPIIATGSIPPHFLPTQLFTLTEHE